MLTSKTCRPSNPAGTGCPSQVVVPGAELFQERTTMSSHTTTSPWSPLQNARPISVGLSASEMSMIRNPSQLPL